ncbi:hypothetical protein LCGC14_1392990 [marine sediment metagenome]|uniref:LamG-like jellyroll fold domain-containing protein n=1 Tax=marine sediment metagenome TaxID=412755 RepID=A0A0F9JZC4_9ZZZZ
MKKILIIILFILIPLNAFGQSLLPSYKQGYARNTSASMRPNLWKGLVGYWKPSLGVTGITTLRDISRFANHGTMQGSMSIEDWVIGGNPKSPGYVLDYEGTDDFIQTTNNTLLNADHMTLAVWFRVDGFADEQILLWQGEAGGNGWGPQDECHLTIGDFITTDLNTVSFWWGIGNPQADDMSLNMASFSDTANWHLAVVTISGINSSPVGELFFDGVSVDTDTALSADLNTINWDTDLRIGRPGTAARFFNGLIDNVCIWNRALLPAEILDMYVNPNAMFQLRSRVVAKAPAVAPSGIPIFRRRIESFLPCHNDRMVVFKTDKPCMRKLQAELAFND